MTHPTCGPYKDEKSPRPSRQGISTKRQGYDCKPISRALWRIDKLFYICITKKIVTKICVICAGCYPDTCDALADSILDYTGCHPYYSQQLAANLWQVGVLQPEISDPLRTAIDHIVTTHGLDYEKLWMNFKRTNKWIMQRLSSCKPLQTGEYRTSTIYSALKRMQKDGYVIYSDHYEMEDPFFREWIARENK